MDIELEKFIKTLSISDKKTLSQKALKTTEEVGELAKCVLPFDSADGTSHRFINKEKILEEICDIYLTSMSIAHSLNFTKDEIEDMILKKAKKWAEIQSKENKISFPLPYEIHITVDLSENIKTQKELDIEIEKFKNICSQIKVKPIVLDLEINNISSIRDIMTSSKHFGDNRTAYEECDRINKYLTISGYKVVRKKIETVPFHPAAPIKKDSNYFMPENCYFESHISIPINIDQKKDLIQLISNGQIAKLKPRLSKNFFKKSMDNRFINMLTYRSHSIGYIEFKENVELIKNELSKSKFDYEKVEVEFAICDTNNNHDIKWIN